MSVAHTTQPANEAATRGLVSYPSFDDASDGDVPAIPALKRAVVYLRVSSVGQVNTDFDPEGISIPAQRAACERKIEQMGDVELIEEYVEPGKSGTSMDRRPAFQAMLKRIREERDVDYVVIYKLSRMNRNRVDDAMVLMQLRKYGVTLVSATEMIDATPEGQLMHGVLASFNEFRSAADGADIRYKMGEKAKKGGTLGRAPIGYLNVRERVDGHEVRSVAPDPDRASYITLAFELYATGEFTLQALCDELTERGLRTRPDKTPSGPISDAKLCKLLRDPYYLGLITYKGEIYEGRHEALVTPEVFDAVQEVLRSKQKSSERQRKHHHYLKGALWCGACHQAGRESRMLIQRSVGAAGGTYFYFFCAGRQRHVCDEPHLRIEDVESAVEAHYRKLTFTPEFVALVQARLADVLDDEQRTARLLRQQLETQLNRLDRQEENLLDLAADGELPKSKIKIRLRKIAVEREDVERRLGTVHEDLQAGAQVIQSGLKLLARPAELYQSLDSQGRRAMNQSVFTKLYLHRDTITEDVLNAPFADLVEIHRAGTVVEVERAEGTQKSARGRWAPKCHQPLVGTGASLLATALGDESSSKDVLVELGRIELPSAKRLTNLLRPFPWLSRDGWLPAGSVGLRHRLVFPRRQWSVPTVSGLSRRQPSLLLPGCGGQAPCAIAGHDVSLARSDDQAARAKSPSALLWVPRLTSLSNSGRIFGFRVSTSKPVSPLSRNRHPVRAGRRLGHGTGPP